MFRFHEGIIILPLDVDMTVFIWTLISISRNHLQTIIIQKYVFNFDKGWRKKAASRNAPVAA
jgi:hypothetical protein